VVAGAESHGDRLAVGHGGLFVLDPTDNTRIIGTTWQLVGALDQPAGTFLGQPQLVQGDLAIALWEGTLAALDTDDGSLRWGWERPVGSDWMNAVGANGTTVFVAVNSVPFGD
jgi:outer membrane protein assembly factor BamB